MDLSTDELEQALTSVRVAWRTANPDAKDDEMPDVLKAAENDPEEKPSRDYLTALWTRIKELAGSAISKDDFDAAHRSALSSAGGKASAKSKAKAKQQTATEFREHAERHPEPVQGCEYCSYGYPIEILKLPKSDARVNYRTADLTGVVTVGGGTEEAA